MSKLVVEGTRALAEVCVEPVAGRRNVGLIAMPRHPNKGWAELTPGEARRLADALERAADEAEGLNG